MRLGAKAQGETGRGGFARKGAMQSSEWEVEHGVNLRGEMGMGRRFKLVVISRNVVG